MIKDWIDIVRSADHFNLVALHSEELILSTPIVAGNPSSSMPGPRDIRTEYDRVRTIKKVPDGFEGPIPNYIGITEAQSLVDCKDRPHAEDPAPAQRCANIAFIWGRPITDQNFPNSMRQFTFAEGFELHQDNGFPAFIEAIGLTKHYTHGKLNRKGQHPALKADYIFAHWILNGKAYRNNGPVSICIKDYREFWDDGRFVGHKWSTITPYWLYRHDASPPDEDVLDDFLRNLKGKTSPFYNSYFQDAEDEVVYMADFS